MRWLQDERATIDNSVIISVVGAYLSGIFEKGSLKRDHGEYFKECMFDKHIFSHYQHLKLNLKK
jgi:hypothetical protein